MEMLLTPPTASHQDNYSGDTILKYVQECGSQPEAIDKDLYGDLTVLIDEDGSLIFEYYRTAPNNNRDEPPDEQTVMYYCDCLSVEAAKSMARIVLLDIENATQARWIDFGFKREEV